MVDSGASLHVMSKSYLTPEESETIRKQRIHQSVSLQMELPTRLKKQQHLSVIWTCLFKINVWKNHPRYTRWVNCA